MDCMGRYGLRSVCDGDQMKIEVLKKIEGAVLDCLLETANPEYQTAETLSEDGKFALVVREGDAVIFALGFVILEQPHGKEIEVIGINGTRKNIGGWLPKALKALRAISKEVGANRILVPVESERIEKALEWMGGTAFSTILKFAG